MVAGAVTTGCGWSGVGGVTAAPVAPAGVVGVVAPQGSSLLGLVSVVAPVIVTGNTCVVATSHERPLPAITFSEVLATSDVPGGVVNVLTGALRQLFALSEAYPDLKANQNFSELQEELTATEGRVAYARQFHNDAVLKYNNKIQQFPGMVLAGPMKFSPREYFEAEEGAREVPKVQF